jgi:hypothetical protein
VSRVVNCSDEVRLSTTCDQERRQPGVSLQGHSGLGGGQLAVRLVAQADSLLRLVG